MQPASSTAPMILKPCDIPIRGPSALMLDSFPIFWSHAGPQRQNVDKYSTRSLTCLLRRQ